MTQQIHSLRARGVRLFHSANTLESDTRLLRRSAGTLCTVPIAIFFLATYVLYSTRVIECQPAFAMGSLSGLPDHSDIQPSRNSQNLPTLSQPGPPDSTFQQANNDGLEPKEFSPRANPRLSPSGGTCPGQIQGVTPQTSPHHCSILALMRSRTSRVRASFSSRVP